MKIRRSRSIPAYVPTASMADIAFLLIIFFMVTTVFDVDRSSVKLPTSETQVDLERGAAVVVVARDPVDPDRVVYRFSDGIDLSAVVRRDQLPGLIDGALDRFASDRQEHRFVVKAGGALPYRRIDETLELLRDRGATNVFLLTATRSRE